MQLFVSAVRPQAGEPVTRDLVVAAQGDSTVGDLAVALDRSLPLGDVAAAEGQAGGAALRLVVSAGQARRQEGPVVDLWAGTTLLDPGDLLAGGPVHDGMLLGLGAAVPEGAGLGEPDGVVELRVVSGLGAGAVHRLGLGTYTLGGTGCDIALEGLEDLAQREDLECPEGLGDPDPVEGAQGPEPPRVAAVVATVSVRVGGAVVLSVDPEVAGRMAPVPPLRRRRLPGPLVLESRDEAGEGRDGRSTRSRRRSLRGGGGRRGLGRRGRRRGQEEAAPVLRGREEVDPDAPRHLVEMDRRPVSREVSWREGAVLRVGQTLLTVGALPEADAVTSPTPEATTLDFNRPPRLARPGRRTEFALPRPPQRPRRQPFPFAMMVSPMVMGAGMYLVTGRVYSLLFMVLSPVMMIANRVQGRSGARRTYRENLRRYEQQRGEVEEAAFRALSQERRLRRADSPDPAEVLLRATGPRSTLWERRPTDPDWLELRVGTADLPSDVVLQDPDRARHEEELRWTAPDVPVTVPVARTGVVGVCGAHRHRLASWLTAQAAALHSPAELEMVLVMDPGQGEEARCRWEWARWLPHLRGAEGVGARVRVGADEESVARRVAELVDLVDARREQGEAAGTGVVPAEQVLVVLDGAHALRQRPGMVHVLRAGPSVGVHVVCVDTDRTWLPEECRAVVEAGVVGASVSLTGRDQVEQVLADLVPPGWCERLARCLAPVNDVSAQGAEGAVPSSSRLLDVLGLPEPDARAVLERWRQVGRTTRAVIGEDAEGLFSVDVSAHGPHALVAGTTGSGKSELLQTLIASLCVGNTPEAMTFVLVDYKGGAAFKDCARLPHTVGMVTDLDGHLTSRALESLGAELRRREHQLAGADAKDIKDYVAAAGSDDEPMPRLMIVIDEFAALVAELPEFVEGLVDVARRGRSLGVHLVLATQRPAGVVSAEIKSNTNLRIALRVTDENDSQDVVEASAAARIPPSLPGRAWARLGHASLRAFQSSRVGGRPAGAVPRASLRALPLTLAELSHPEAAAPEVEEDATVPTDLATLVSAVGEAYESLGRPAPHSPWLPPLPEVLTLEEAVAARGQGARDQGAQGQDGLGGQDGPAPDPRGEGHLPPVVLGLEDVPGEQDQRPMTWDYTRGGHLGVAGAPRSGRSALLRLVAVGIARSASAAEVHLYGIDAGAGALLPCLSLPHCGAVVTRGESDRIRRLLALLSGEVARRQQYLASRGLASLAEQRVVAPEGERMPYLVLLIDRWDSFTAVYETTDGGAFLDQVEALMREGAAVGLRVVVTGDRRVLRGRFGMALEDRLLLRMPEAEDFEAVGMRPREVPQGMPPGRGFRAGVEAPREVQVALLEADGSGAAQAAAVHAAARWAAGHWGEVPRESRPGGVDDLPVTISAGDALRLGPSLRPGEVALAVGGDSLGVVPIDLEDVGNSVLVTGPRRSGRSTALLFATGTALEGGLSVVLVLPRRSPLAALEGHPGVAGVLGLESRPEELTRLVGQSPGRTLVVVDDAEYMGSEHPLNAALDARLVAARDTPGGVLVACGVDEIPSMYRGVVARGKKNRTVLLLAPRSATDASVLDLRLPASTGGPVPKGRGVLFTTTGWSWVQVPRTGPEDLEGVPRDGS